MPLESGARLGVYEVVAPVGAGGMGEVYRAHDTSLNRDVALKVLPQLVASDPDRLMRFQREAESLAALNHPNIAQIHGVERGGPTPALVLELVEGPTLADRIAAGRIPAEEALPIAYQIADALEAAHEAGIIHRDLKPANIKVRDDGTVKVLDFGLAKALGPESAGAPAGSISDSPTVTSPALTQMGLLLGTAAYMAPEQARGRPVDKRADIWAFGCVLYEMLTGRKAFEGEDVPMTLAEIMKADPPLDALPADAPRAVRAVLRRCFQKDPRRRMRDIGDVRLELAEPGERETASAARPPGRTGWSSTLGAAAVGALAAALVAAVIWWSWAGRFAPSAGVSRVTILPPEGLSLYPDSAEVALSPDGRWIAMVTGTPETLGGSQIWLRSIDSMTPRLVEGAGGGHLPFWSPDSRQLAFFADDKLKTVPVAGGRPTIVCDAPSGRGGTWGSRNVIVFAPDGTGPLLQVAAGGGVPAPATTLNAGRHETGHRFPQFLPDGEHFLYAALPGKGSVYNVFVGSIAGGAPELIGSFETVPVYADPGWLIFLRQGSLAAQAFDRARRRLAGGIVPLDDAPAAAPNPSTAWTAGQTASVSRAGTLVYVSNPAANTKAVWLDATGRIVGTLAVPPAPYTSVGIAPDGTRAAVVRRVSGTEARISLLDLARGTLVPLSTGPGVNNSPVWSPDGTKVVFASDRDGPVSLFIKDVTTSEPERLFYRSPAAFKNPSSWSPDGRRIVLTQFEPDRFQDLFWLPASGDAEPVRIVSTPGIDMLGKVSPDGRWMAYASDVSGRLNIYVQPFPEPGPPVPVTSAGASDVWWRPDGRELVILNEAGTELLATDVASSDASFRAGPPRVVATLPPGVLALDAAPDLSRFLALIPESSTARWTVTLLANWPAALEARRQSPTR